MVKRLRRAIFEMRMATGEEPSSIHLTETDFANFRYELDGPPWDVPETIWTIPFFLMKGNRRSHVRGPFGRAIELVDEGRIEAEQKQAIEAAQARKNAAP